MKKKILIGTAVVLVGAFVIWLFFGNASTTRMIKHWMSDRTGGIERVATVYSNTGDVIEQFHGKIDVTDSADETELLIDNDEVVIIHGGIVIIKEVK